MQVILRPFLCASVHREPALPRRARPPSRDLRSGTAACSPGRTRTARTALGARFLKVTPCRALCRLMVYSREITSFDRDFLSTPGAIIT